MNAHQSCRNGAAPRGAAQWRRGESPESIPKSAKERSAVGTQDMVVYMVDRDLPGFTVVQLRMLQQGAITACQRFSAAGRPIEYLRSMVIPGESRCMCLFVAPDLALVQAVNDAAQLPF